MGIMKKNSQTLRRAAQTLLDMGDNWTEFQPENSTYLSLISLADKIDQQGKINYIEIASIHKPQLSEQGWDELAEIALHINSDNIKSGYMVATRLLKDSIDELDPTLYKIVQKIDDEAESIVFWTGK